MALQVSGLPRKFEIKVGGTITTVDDPNPSLTPENVRDLLAVTYPEITSGSVQGPEMKKDCVLYKITSVVGVKG
ncbi:MAG: PRTRC system protein C [Deltaproteobacteria bacterium RIFOXYD12_FULL_50_9]|nr:MAG: PRTRC system protein C [Deltaproteobacteria bacterium RIFOXYD12_FULL_50_9]